MTSLLERSPQRFILLVQRSCIAKFDEMVRIQLIERNEYTVTWIGGDKSAQRQYIQLRNYT